jgi:hypothetical protein
MRSLLAAIVCVLVSGASVRAADLYAPRFTAGGSVGALQGFVLDAESKPVAGAEVIAIATPRAGYQGLFPRDPSAPTLRAETDAKGAFSIAVQEQRSFEVRVRDTAGRIAYAAACAPREVVSLRVAQPAELTVELYDARSGQPLAGVEVAAQWTETALLRQHKTVPHRIASGLTGKDGRATIENLPPGVMDVVYEPSASGLASTRAWRVLAGEKVALRIPVAEERRTFTGSVTDRAGNPVPGARIATSLRFDRFTIADDEGRFEFTTFIPMGELSLFVQADGFALEQRVLADPLRNQDPILVQLPPGRVVSGKLVGPDAQPLAGVPIVLVHDAHSTIEDQVRAVSAVDGSFQVHGLRADAKHVLVAKAPGLGLCARVLGDEEFGSPDLKLGAVTVHPGAVVEGQFQDSAGGPIQKALISLTIGPEDPRASPQIQPLDTPFGAVPTTADGRFHFDGLPAGGVVVTGLAQNTMKREMFGITAGGSRLDLVVRSIAELRPADPKKGECGGTLAARVLLPDGARAVRVNVQLLPDDDSGVVLRQAFTDETGTFTFTELHGGRYRMLLELRDGFPETSPLRARRRLSPDELAALVARQPDAAERTIALREVVLVKGRVEDPREPGGRPWFVRADPADDLGAPTCVASDDTGRFVFAMEAGGRMTLWVSPLPASPGVPRSALNAVVVQPFPVRDLVAGNDELVIRVP